ncbi:nuclear transport factor 2 family protein [Bergeriella denitrificans]|uniref:Predicted ester cyclase n=1 Tax=Bergeriella denitrificans TaxID=494 RepID=A0A378UGM4_BERDE|nr:nuclear transport factor 2 family protein [Bergeriella denitrificans]STZ76538.1 Predicted ester cyclase [Bergeriella denitrificans]
MTLTPNQQNVVDFYDMVFNQHKAAEAAEQYLADDYIQHNPTLADGKDGFVASVSPILAAVPTLRAEIKRVIAQDDLVVLHVHMKMHEADIGKAIVDIFRVNADGKLSEHWDVIQDIPEQAANGNGMF